jgi:hypothetical protein
MLKLKQDPVKDILVGVVYLTSHLMKLGLD